MPRPTLDLSCEPKRSQPRELSAAIVGGPPRRISLTRTRASSNTTAQGWPQLAREIHRTQSHDYAWYTCHSRSSSYTCHSRCSSEFAKVEIGFFERGAARLRRGQALVRKPSNAWARKMPALIRPKNVVTVSIIAKILAPRPGQNDIQPRTVKRIPRPDRRSGLTDALVQQIYQEASCERTRRIASDASIPSTP
jgi:hypothetical protein